MKPQKWNSQWKFWSDKDAFSMNWNVPENARDITLPHDAMIENKPYEESPNGGNTGYRDGGNYTYVKQLFIPEEAEGLPIILKFDGIYCNASVYVNQQFVTFEPNGYTVFYADLTPYIKAGENNEVRVTVKNAGMTNSRWYSGSGIYRDVTLLTSGPVFLKPGNLYITTEEADKELAVLKIQNTIESRLLSPGTYSLRTVVKDSEGVVCASETSVFFLKGNSEKTLTQRVTVTNPRLWYTQGTALYTAECTLICESRELDFDKETFGIRVLKLDAQRGLRINDESVKLKGVCIHHDSGIIGAATYQDAMLRQMQVLKSFGYNAIRIAHHPAAPALLKACDLIGMLVMDEFTDMWNRSKSDLDYSLHFPDWWEKDLKSMIQKDYNHPSVVLYSVGNEIPEIGEKAGSETCAAISDAIKKLDPTRYTTAGINGAFILGDQMGRVMADLADDTDTSGNVNNFMTLMDKKMADIVRHDAVSEKLELACASLDVAGYNYMAARYEGDRNKYPNRVIVGSETYPPDIAYNWALVEKLPNVIGDFTWTGWDYIGEAGVGIPAYAFGEGGFGARFPAQLAYCGDFELTGVPRPMAYLRHVVFTKENTPYIAVQNPHHYGETLIKTPWVLSDAIMSWDWPGCENHPVTVEVYASGDEVELLLNEKSLGKKPVTGSRVLFETFYKPGTLKAVNYKNGNSVGENYLMSCTGKKELRLEKTFEGKELIYIDVSLTDDKGTLVTSSDDELTVSVKGAELLGFGSGDPKPSYNYNEGRTKTWYGKAQIILKKSDESPITVHVDNNNGLCTALIL